MRHLDHPDHPVREPTVHTGGRLINEVPTEKCENRNLVGDGGDALAVRVESLPIDDLLRDRVDVLHLNARSGTLALIIDDGRPDTDAGRIVAVGESKGITVVATCADGTNLIGSRITGRRPGHAPVGAVCEEASLPVAGARVAAEPLLVVEVAVGAVGRAVRALGVARALGHDGPEALGRGRGGHLAPVGAVMLLHGDGRLADPLAALGHLGHPAESIAPILRGSREAVRVDVALRLNGRCATLNGAYELSTIDARDEELARRQVEAGLDARNAVLAILAGAVTHSGLTVAVLVLGRGVERPASIEIPAVEPGGPDRAIDAVLPVLAGAEGGRGFGAAGGRDAERGLVLNRLAARHLVGVGGRVGLSGRRVRTARRDEHDENRRHEILHNSLQEAKVPFCTSFATRQKAGVTEP